MRLIQSVAIGTLSLALSCGGRAALQPIDGQAGSRATGGDPGFQATGGDPAFQATGGDPGFRATGGDPGSQGTAGSSQATWVARGDFDELPLGVIPEGTQYIHLAVAASGEVYLASESTPIDSKRVFDLTRVSPDGRGNWTQRINGASHSLIVDAVGTIYQSRTLNGVGVLDKRTPDGRWLWSREIETMSLRVGRDGALYGAAWGERLRKFDGDGNVLWTWQGPGNLGVSGFGADATGTVFVRTGVRPAVQLPSGAKGQPSPQDGLLFTLDQGGAELSQRRYSTGVFEPTAPGTVVYLETGPINFAVTSEGRLLSVPLTGVGLYDPSGDAALWQWDARDVKPSSWDLSNGFSGALSAGSCAYCAASRHALYAFDAEGNQAKTLLLGEYSASAWAADNLDNIYALVEFHRVAAVRRYHGESGWSPAQR